MIDSPSSEMQQGEEITRVNKVEVAVNCGLGAAALGLVGNSNLLFAGGIVTFGIAGTYDAVRNLIVKQH